MIALRTDGVDVSMAIRAHSVTPPTVPNRMSGCEHLDTPRIRFFLASIRKVCNIAGICINGFAWLAV